MAEASLFVLACRVTLRAHIPKPMRQGTICNVGTGRDGQASAELAQMVAEVTRVKRAAGVRQAFQARPGQCAVMGCLGCRYGMAAQRH